MGHYKTFNGKRYRYYAKYATKWVAMSKAKELRKKGYLARVIHLKGKRYTAKQWNKKFKKKRKTGAYIRFPHKKHWFIYVRKKR